MVETSLFKLKKKNSLAVSDEYIKKVVGGIVTVLKKTADKDRARLIVMEKQLPEKLDKPGLGKLVDLSSPSENPESAGSEQDSNDTDNPLMRLRKLIPRMLDPHPKCCIDTCRSRHIGQSRPNPPPNVSELAEY